MVSKRLPKAFKYDLPKFLVKVQLHFPRDGQSKN